MQPSLIKPLQSLNNYYQINMNDTKKALITIAIAVIVVLLPILVIPGALALSAVFYTPND